MNRSNKNKIAVTLLGVLAFGASAQAQDLNKNKVTKMDSFQINGTKAGAVTSKKSSDKNEIVRTDSFSIFGKVVTGTLVALGAAESANETVAGVMWAKNKESDSIFKGKYSLVNLIRSNKIKKRSKPRS